MSRPRLLVLRALGLGDLCTAVPALRALRRAYPRHLLTLAAPAWQEPLARAIGVDEVVDTAPLAGLDPRLDGADVAVNLHGRGPQSTLRLVATRPRLLLAFDHPLLHPALLSRVVEWRDDEHDTTRWCRLLQEFGIAADPDERDLPPPAPATDVRQNRVVVHPGAASPARRWPPERFAAIVDHLLGSGRDVVLTGTAAEWSLCQNVVEVSAGATSPRLVNIAGRTTVLELAATVAGASLVVSNDTGVAHLASAYHTPSVVLFGPTPPDEWGPPSGGPHIALWSGRRGDPQGTELDAGLASLGVEAVREAIEALDKRHGCRNRPAGEPA